MEIQLDEDTGVFITACDDGSFEVDDGVYTLHTSETLNGAILWIDHYGHLVPKWHQTPVSGPEFAEYAAKKLG